MKTLVGIPYAAAQDAARALDLYLPTGECRATLVFFHGGGLEGGSRGDCARVMARYAARGVAVACADYRMYPDAIFPDYLRDAAEAVAWTFRHAAEYGMSEKIFIGGSSAGAYLALMLCFDRQYLENEGVTPGDARGYLFNAGATLKHYNIARHEGGDERAVRVDESSAIYHVNGSAPDRPLLFLWAENDMPRRAEENRLMLAALAHNGYDMRKVESREMAGYRHCGYDGVFTADGESLFVEMTMPFIERNL